MLTDTDPGVRAELNLRAVLGVIPQLVETVPEARALLAGLTRPVTLTLAGPGLPGLRLVFEPDRVTAGGPARGARGWLLFRSPAHLNAVIDGRSRPVPVGGPQVIRMLTGVFGPLTGLLGQYLSGEPAAARDERAATLLGWHAAAHAVAVVAQRDRGGAYSAGQMPDGTVDIEIGTEARHRLRIRGHRVTVVAADGHPPRAVLRFADVGVAGDVLAGRVSAVSGIGDGRVAVHGYLPLVDVLSRILDRVGHYFRK